MDFHRSELIYRNLAEIIGKERLDDKIASNHPLVAYIGFAPTGQIHLGYLLPCMKIRDLTLANCRVAIMLADIHAILDERKTPSHLIQSRTEYYEAVLKQILLTLGANLNLIKFVRGSEFQFSPSYTMDVWDLASRVTISAAKKAGTEVVKQTKDPKLGSAMYPLMQAVDEKYVGKIAFDQEVDIELGGLDQRKIFCFSHDQTGSAISYLMNPIVSLTKNGNKSGNCNEFFGKMSATDPNGKINFTDSKEVIEGKIKKAFCADGDANCGLMKLMACVFFSIHDVISLTNDDREIVYTSYQEFENDFQTGVFNAIHLKRTIANLIYKLIVPIQDFLSTQIMVRLTEVAYT